MALLTSLIELLLFIQWFSCFIFFVQLNRMKKTSPYTYNTPIKVVRPYCGLEHNLKENIESTRFFFKTNAEIIFCLKDKSDPTYPFLLEFKRKNFTEDIEILIGPSKLENPKLANLEKSVSYEKDYLYIFIDSNVLIDQNYLGYALYSLSENVGVVSAPPIGTDAQNFWADLESSFLNTLQARWQYIAKFFGIGFVQGKNIIISNQTLRLIGGLKKLDTNFSEDAALTKEIKKLNLEINVMYPMNMDLGMRSFSQIWNRQTRWAKLRRKTFVLFYIPEIFLGSLPLILSMVVVGYPFFLIVGGVILFYIPEILLSYYKNWNTRISFIFSLLIRDLLMPFLWISGWGNKIVWRGNFKNLK